MFTVTNVAPDPEFDRLVNIETDTIDLETFCVLGASLDDDYGPQSDPKREVDASLTQTPYPTFKRQKRLAAPLLLTEQNQDTISTLFPGSSIPTKLFMSCLVNLMVGRESIMFSFRHKSMRFAYKHVSFNQIKVPGVSSTALESLVQECLVSGSLFQRLKMTSNAISSKVTRNDSIVIAFDSALSDILDAIQHYIETLCDDSQSSLLFFTLHTRSVHTIVHLLANLLGCGDLGRALQLSKLPDPIALLSELYRRVSVYKTSDTNLHILTAELFARSVSPWLAKLHGIIGVPYENSSDFLCYWKLPSEMVDSEMFVVQALGGFLSFDKAMLPVFMTSGDAQTCVEILTGLHILYNLGDISAVGSITKSSDMNSSESIEKLIPALDMDLTLTTPVSKLLVHSVLFDKTMEFLVSRVEDKSSGEIHSSDNGSDTDTTLRGVKFTIEKQQELVNVTLMTHVNKYLSVHLECVRRFFLLGLGATDLCHLLFHDNKMHIKSFASDESSFSSNWPPLNSDLCVLDDITNLYLDSFGSNRPQFWFSVSHEIPEVPPESIHATAFVNVSYVPPVELKYLFLENVISGYKNIFARLLKLARCVLFLQTQQLFSFHDVLQMQYLHVAVIESEWFKFQRSATTKNFMSLVKSHNLMIDNLNRKLFLDGENNIQLDDYLQSLLDGSPIDVPRVWR